ncbi:ATP-binding cassette domain-containing protein [Flavobacterium sp.]|uniref:ABC transporter ATP-binding protein n=1 Tax=Flavobacterium sp. TaxID=239 RepID=UPI00286E9AE8|nr:ATP-binding cassette domain-containing protein [Flavobacterium sp.]
MIATKNIAFSYPNGETFQLPDLHCEASNTVLITGNSGKGKTTYLHLLAGLLKPNLGEIVINEVNINSLSNKNKDQFRGQNIGVVFQKSHFIASLSVLENIEMASWLAFGSKNTSKAKKLLQELDLLEFQNKLPSQLSVGQQQRVSIARALINEPKVLLADEPTSSLDDDNAFKVADLLEKLAKEYNAALVIVTHDLRLKNKFTNQINLI